MLMLGAPAVACARRVSLVLVLAVVSVACSESTGPGSGGGRTSQVVLTSRATSVGVGKTLALDVEVLNASGEATDAGVSWSSSNTSVATVSGGVVTGKALGTTIIRATAGSASATITLTVGAPVASVTLADVAPVGLPVGGQLTLTSTLRDASGALLDGRLVTWTTTSAAIARVENGALIGVGNGVTNVIASAEGRADTASVTVVAPLTLTRALATSGSMLACGLTTVGAAWCWGSILGERPSSNLNQLPWPRAIGGGAFFKSIAVSDSHACGLTADGQAWCWGSNSKGQLGSTSASMYVAAPVQTTQRFVSIHPGNEYTLALATDGSAWAWGAGGHLGDSTSVDRATPVRVAGGLTFRLLGNNKMGGGVGITAGNVLYHWPATSPYAPSVVPDQSLAFVQRLTTLYVAGSTVAGLSSTGELWAWTYFAEGNGIGSTYTPARLQPTLTFRKIELDQSNAMGITTDGALVSWGYRAYGVLGNGSSGDSYQTTAVQPSGGRTYVDFTMRDGVVFAIDAAGQTYAWGADGDNTLALGKLNLDIYTTPQAPVKASLVYDLFGPPLSLAIEPGATDSVAVIFRAIGGSFNRSGNGMAVPKGPQTLSIQGLPSGVSTRVRREVMNYGFGPVEYFVVAFSVSEDAKFSDLPITIQGSASGAEPGNSLVGFEVLGPPGPPLNLVCTSSTTPSSFPPGYHCMTHAGANVPGKISIAAIIGSWYESSAGVCVNYGSSGVATTRFKPGLGGGAVTTASGKWGAISEPDGSTTPAPAGGLYIFTAAHDDQMKLLVFYPNAGAFDGYSFQRGSCPW